MLATLSEDAVRRARSHQLAASIAAGSAVKVLALVASGGMPDDESSASAYLDCLSDVEWNASRARALLGLPPVVDRRQTPRRTVLP